MHQTLGGGLTLVGAAILMDVHKRFLFAQRPAGKSWEGYLEFPGGKIHEGESPRIGLARELKEELGITVAPEALKPLSFIEHTYQEGNILMLAYRCDQWLGTPEGLEGQPLMWLRLSELQGHKVLPADDPLLNLLDLMTGKGSLGPADKPAL
ncbi:MAG: (deoxy)nucleoside triphosphate pyrophosphohydrolase [Alphaproteobacteria bacterium]